MARANRTCRPTSTGITTPELAQAHGVRASYSDFSFDYIRAVAQQYIDPAFLALD